MGKTSKGQVPLLAPPSRRLIVNIYFSAIVVAQDSLAILVVAVEILIKRCAIDGSYLVNTRSTRIGPRRLAEEC